VGDARAQMRVALKWNISYCRQGSTNVTIFRHILPVKRAQCRVTLDSAFHHTRCNVELRSTCYFTALYVGYP